MLFTSLEFIFLFLPIVLIINYILPKALSNYWLLLASLFFYAWGEPKFVFVMVGSILFNYLCALGIGGCAVRWGKKAVLGLAVLGNLSVLFIYKYLNFTTSVLSRLFPNRGMAATEILLPIGISFFTFQALSYVIDVYRGVAVQKNPAKIGLYISLFPQLIAGPIVRYTTVQEQIDRRTITLRDFEEGLLRFVQGFNKKILLANSFAVVADMAFAAAGTSVATAWLGAVSYTLQIFFDFSGYSDMAIGLGRMLGFHFLENFNYPYISKTISEFWRRWHISMGSWFRDYVYFPLGGSRVKTKGRLIFNLAVVWLATGIWHGANWTFLVWGLLYGVLIIFEKLCGIENRLKGWKLPARLIYQAGSLVLIISGWVLFRSGSLGQAGEYLKTMFGLNGAALTDGSFVFYLREYALYFAAGILCCTPLFKKMRQRLSAAPAAIWQATACLWQAGLLLISVSQLVINAHNPFIYFNF